MSTTSDKEDGMTQHSVSISGVDIIDLYFSAAKPTSLPAGLPRAESVEVPQRSIGDDPADGLVIEPVAECGANRLSTHLARAGFTMVDAYRQERISRNGNKYHSVRYVFCRGASRPSERLRLEDVNERARKSLSWALSTAMWKMFVFKHGDDDTSTGSYMSINFKERRPYYDVNGEPIMRKRFDPEIGEKVAKPVMPAFRVQLHEDLLRVCSTTSL